MQPDGKYAYVHLCGVPYLLPYGQSVADHCRGVKLGVEGAEAWELLERSQDLKEFLSSASQGHADERERLEAERDHLSFINSLQAMGVLAQREPRAEFVPARAMKVAGLRIGFAGRVNLLSEAFDSFATEVAGEGSDVEGLDQTVLILRSALPRVEGARVVLQTPEVVVLDHQTRWVLLFHTHPALLGCTVTKDGAEARFYVDNCAEDEMDALREELFHAIRFAFLVLAQQRDRYVLHSCSVHYRDYALLFSGSSGTGKSTHAALWADQFGVAHLNGDLNLLYIEDGEARVAGLPWCGTSGISQRFDLPCAGVVLLRQAPRNQVQPLAQDEQQLFLMNRLISPTWNEELQLRTLDFAGSYAPATHVCRYLATRDATSAHVLRAEVDRWLDADEGKH